MLIVTDTCAQPSLCIFDSCTFVKAFLDTGTAVLLACILVLMNGTLSVYLWIVDETGAITLMSRDEVDKKETSVACNHNSHKGSKAWFGG